MNQSALIFVCVCLLAFGTGLVESRRPEQKQKCKIVPTATTTCTGVTGTNCQNSSALVAILVAGQTQANVCPKYYSASVLANITVSFKVYGVNCQTYLGVTSICFAPPATETRTCAELATDLTFSRVSCTDQVALTARLPTTSIRICLLNAAVTPNVFEDKTVNLAVKLAGTEGQNSGEWN